MIHLTSSSLIGYFWLNRKHRHENFWKEEAEHFDVQKPLTIQSADKEKIGKVETGHHKLKISAIYNIEGFEFTNWSNGTQIKEWSN